MDTLFFWASKLLWALISPDSLLLILLLCGAVRSTPLAAVPGNRPKPMMPPSVSMPLSVWHGATRMRDWCSQTAAAVWPRGLQGGGLSAGTVAGGWSRGAQAADREPVAQHRRKYVLQQGAVAAHLLELRTASKEWLSLVAYYLSGRTDRLLPDESTHCLTDSINAR